MKPSDYLNPEQLASIGGPPAPPLSPLMEIDRLKARPEQATLTLFSLMELHSAERAICDELADLLRYARRNWWADRERTRLADTAWDRRARLTLERLAIHRRG